MGKSIFRSFSFHDIANRIDFKTNVLLFDSIYVDKRWFIDFVVGLADTGSILTLNYKDLNYLIENGIVVPFSITQEAKDAHEIIENIKLLIPTSEVLKLQAFMRLKGEITLSVEEMTSISSATFDIFTRLGVQFLKKKGVDNVSPFLISNTSFENGRSKQDVLRFVLNKLPVPDENTPWEQIMDFRNDPDSKSKYYALIQWVNTVASLNRPICETEDEFEYLYDQYHKHFGLHKMKTNLTTWEMIVAGGLEVLTATQGMPTFFKNLFSISKTRIELMQDEMKLPGQEIAYIHKAKEMFK